MATLHRNLLAPRMKRYPGSLCEKQVIGGWIRKSTVARLDELAQELGASRCAYIRWLLEQHVEEQTGRMISE